MYKQCIFLKYMHACVCVRVCIYIYIINIHSTHIYCIMYTKTFILDAINHDE